MNRKCCYLIISMLFLLCQAGCAPAAKQEQTTSETMIVYEKLPLPDLFISIPEGYEETSSQFYETYYCKDDASIIITEDESAVNTPSRDYAVSALNQYQSVTQTLEVLNDEVMAAGAATVQVLEFTYTLTADDTPMTTMAAFATDGLTSYIITCKSRADTYDLHRPEFLAAVQSVRIDKTWVGKGAEAQDTEAADR